MFAELQSKRRMTAVLLALLMPAAIYGGEQLFELSGRVQPAGEASVSLYGATKPFSANTISGPDGRFRFRKLQAGTYTIGIFFPERGEARQTVEVGAGTADARGRVVLDLHFKDSDFEFSAAARQHAVSVGTLAIPGKALSEYEAAQKDMGRHDAAGATAHLQRAVKLAPQFDAAWNEMGTIAYQTRDYPRAEACFREALVHDPAAFEPLVNLGGALLTENKLDEALLFNQLAIKSRPRDALANSQLGQTYFARGDLDSAVKYLEIARGSDPAHFSHPQLVLAEIHLRRGENGAAADDLEDFLKYHPDYQAAAKIRESIGKLRM
jgi:tetratricopeptide (TPR) repeat protein